MVPIATTLTTYQRVGSQRVMTGVYSMLTDVDPVISLDGLKLLTTEQYNQRADKLRAKVLTVQIEVNEPVLDSNECNEPPPVTQFVLGWSEDLGLLFKDTLLLIK